MEPVAPAELVRLRDAVARGLRDPMWGTELGRLFLEGKLTAEEYEAGRRWGRLVTAYHKAAGIRAPYAKAMPIYRVEPSVEPDSESEEGQRRTRRDQDIIVDMQEAHAVLASGAGILAERAVRSLCEANELPIGVVGLDSLRHGLRWLGHHWHLTKTEN